MQNYTYNSHVYLFIVQSVHWTSCYPHENQILPMAFH